MTYNVCKIVEAHYCMIIQFAMRDPRGYLYGQWSDFEFLVGL
jgi:hypothetical protein